MNTTSRRILRQLSIVLAILGLITVWPHAGAKEVSMLKYKSVCVFAPISTIIALYLALTIHRYLKNTNKEVKTQ